MPNRKVVMEENTQDKVNTMIAKHIDKVSDLSRSQSKVILNHDDRIKDVVTVSYTHLTLPTKA